MRLTVRLVKTDLASQKISVQDRRAPFEADRLEPVVKIQFSKEDDGRNHDCGAEYGTKFQRSGAQ